MRANLCIASALLSAPVWAVAEQALPANDIETIVVTASRIEESLVSIAGTVQVIEQDSIQRQASSGQHLGDVLGKLVPGFAVSSETNTHFNQTIRGRKALILIDGVPQYDNRDISRQLQSISTDNVERVEVVSGASAVYGAGGSGGVINIITRVSSSGENQYSTRLGISTSLHRTDTDANHYKIAQTLNGGKGKFNYLISASFSQTANFYDGQGARIAPEPAQTSTNDTDSYDLLLKLGYDISAQQRLNLSFSKAKSEQDTKFAANYGGAGVPVLFGQTAPVIAVEGLELGTQPLTARRALTLDYRDSNFFGAQLSSQWYYRDRSYRFFPFAFVQNLSLQPAIAGLTGLSSLPVATVAQSTSDAEALGLKLTLSKEFWQELELIWGLDYSSNKGEQYADNYDVNTFISSGGLKYVPTGFRVGYGPDVETKTTALFVQGKYQATDELIVRAGVRYEDISQTVKDSVTPLEASFYQQYASRLAPLAPLLPAGVEFRPARLNGAELDYNETLFNLGLTYSLGTNSEVFVNYTEGFELPDTARVLRDVISASSTLPFLVQGLSTPTVVSETALEAVKVRSAELGWRGRFDDTEVSMVLFRNTSDKTLDFLPNFTVALLDQKRKIQGFEIQLEHELRDDVTIGASYSKAQGTTQNLALGREIDLSSVEVSPPKTSLFVNYSGDGFNLRLQGIRLGSYDYQRIHRGTLQALTSRSYTSLDLLADIQLPVGALSLGVQNLTDRQYQTVYSQWAGHVYGQTAGVPARGRMLSLEYAVQY